MKLNSNTMIVGEKIVLVPYKPYHVEKYHRWMQSEELRILTASEPLTLEEEYRMQESWLNDENKCTFIILENDMYAQMNALASAGLDAVTETVFGSDTEQKKIHETECMIGDVNFFLADEGDEKLAEIEIMIAETKFRGQGRGKEAVWAMLRYGIEYLGLELIQAKIGYANEKSLSLFHKIGFKEQSRSDVFEELTLNLEVDNDFRKKLWKETKTLEIINL